MVRTVGGGGVAALGENGGDGEADYAVGGGSGKGLGAGLAGKQRGEEVRREGRLPGAEDGDFGHSGRRVCERKSVCTVCLASDVGGNSGMV